MIVLQNRYRKKTLRLTIFNFKGDEKKDRGLLGDIRAGSQKGAEAGTMDERYLLVHSAIFA